MVTNTMIELAQAILDGVGCWEALNDACEEAGYCDALYKHIENSCCRENPMGCVALRNIVEKDEERLRIRISYYKRVRGLRDE